jgi:hypothetical protein
MGRKQNIYAEAAVVCPSYWLATAFSGNNRSAYHYQYSVPFAVHGADISAYYGPATDNQGPDFVTAFRSTLPRPLPPSRLSNTQEINLELNSYSYRNLRQFHNPLQSLHPQRHRQRRLLFFLLFNHLQPSKHLA